MMLNCGATREALRELGTDICPACKNLALFHISEANQIELRKEEIKAEAEVRKEEIKAEVRKEEIKAEEIMAEVRKEEIKAEVRKEEIKAEAEAEVRKEEIALQMRKLKLGEILLANIPFYDWNSLQKENIQYSTNMDYNRLRKLLQVAFELNSDFRIYSLPPNALIENRVRVDSESFNKILEPFLDTSSREKLPTLYVFTTDESPVKLPEKKVSRSLTSRSSASQGSLREAVMNRDGICVFCSDVSTILEAAPILDLNRATPELVSSLGLTHENDYRNAIFLCPMCHKFYDGHMLCIHPDSLSLIVCEAFLSCSPHRQKYSPLNGKRVNVSDETISKNHWPSALVLQDRYALFLSKSTERRTKNSMTPHYCIECNKRWKTLKGIKDHVCRLDHNSSTSSYTVGNYLTPVKDDSTEDLDQGVDDNELYL